MNGDHVNALQCFIRALDIKMDPCITEKVLHIAKILHLHDDDEEEEEQ